MTEITEDVVGCLCMFWNDDESEDKMISVLQEIDEDMTLWFDSEECEKSTPYYAGQGLFFQHCEPLEKADVKFYKD